jgi:hypothetical protein
MNEQIKHLGDALAMGTAVVTLTTWLPPIAALCSIVWYLIRFYEYYKTKKIKE